MIGNESPRPVIIDCDPGTDDAIALLLAFASPELHVAAITVAGGNAPLATTLANACSVVALAGRKVAVHAGASRALLGPFPPGWAGHGANGTAGVELPPGRPGTEAIAADAIRAVLRQAVRPFTLVGLAPATNLALALATEPTLAAKIEEIVLLSGALGGGNATKAAEFNAWSDPEALAVVLGSGAPVTLATIETACSALVTPERIAALRAACRGRALGVACAILAALPPSLRCAGRGFPLYDPIAIAWLIRPGIFQTAAVTVTVDLAPGPSRGRTLIRPASRAREAPNAQGAPASRLTGDPVRLLTGLDGDGFFALLAERLARLP